MGGIREKGFFLNCDRCSKDREIVDETQIAFYKKFRDRKDRSHTMFMSMLIGADGEKMASFEWLCPDCVSAISTYLGKAAPAKDEAPKTRGRGKSKDAPPAPDRDASPPEEPDRDAAPTSPEEKSEEVSDNELFD